MARLLIGRRQGNMEAERRQGASAWMPTVFWMPPRFGAFVTRSRRRIAVTALRRPTIAFPPTVRAPEPDIDLSREWIQVGAYVERMAPETVTADELGRTEDAAAERIYQRSRRDAFPGLGAGYFPGSRKRSMPLRRGV
jgi:hypothetical protein